MNIRGFVKGVIGGYERDFFTLDEIRTNMAEAREKGCKACVFWQEAKEQFQSDRVNGYCHFAAGSPGWDRSCSATWWCSEWLEAKVDD